MSRLVVSISHVEFTETDHTFYVVRVQQDADEWQVKRSYSDFRHLRDDVHKVLKDDKHHLVSDDASKAFAHGFHELPFPSKRLFGSKKDHVVKERAQELHHFLIKLLFLTHTYRKTQKQLYDNDSHHPSSSSFSSSASSSHHRHHQEQQQLQQRPHGSVGVFYLLRDFLKPTPQGANGGNGNGNDNSRSNTRLIGSRSGSSRHTHRAETDEDDDHERMLRESRMLNMRTSHHQKSRSAPQLQTTPSTTNGNSNGNGNSQQQQRVARTTINRTPTNAATTTATTPRRAAPPPLPVAHNDAVSSSLPSSSLSSSSSTHPTPLLPSHMENLLVGAPAQPPQAKTKNKQRAASSFTATQSLSPTSTTTAAAAAVTNASIRNSRGSSRGSKPRFNDRISSSDQSTYPVLRSISSDFDLITTTAPPETQIRSLSTSSTASSTASASFHARSLETTSLASSAPGDSFLFNDASASSEPRRRPRSKKKKTLSASGSSSSLSRAEKDMRNSERLSRITPQLTVQAITVDAQKELEKYVSEYNAIMVMRYVDRFISKAVGKTPGCYTVVGSKLVIDSARFVTELDDVFPDLPSGIQDAFKNSSGEWVFPKAVDAYVQMKWNSFQGKSSSSSRSGGRSGGGGGSRGGNGTFASSRASDSDGDDSESDYEFENTGYMKPKDREFTQEVSDELQMMIAEGTAGRDQMLRLRRQFDEQGWHRRTNPGAKHYLQQEQPSSSGNYDESDTDDDDNGSGNDSIKRFQAQQNAMRKSRMSRHDEGGLV